jgi:hypothetical protein
MTEPFSPYAGYTPLTQFSIGSNAAEQQLLVFDPAGGDVVCRAPTYAEALILPPKIANKTGEHQLQISSDCSITWNTNSANAADGTFYPGK